MTDEEKINIPKDVYLRNIFCCDCSAKKTCENDPCDNYEYWKGGYEKGLAEGERIGKEKQWKATEKAQKKTSARIGELEKENARLSKMLEMAINDTIRKGNQCFYCKDNYTKDICDNCTKENRINVMKLYRAELEKRVENKK